MKISEAKFIELFIANGLNPTRVADAITELTGEPYTRQGAYQRAKSIPALKDAISDDLIAESLGVIKSLLSSSDDRVKFSSAKFLLSTLAKNDGFSERTEVTGADGKDITINVVYPKKPA